MMRFNRWVAKNYWLAYYATVVPLMIGVGVLTERMPPVFTFILLLIGVFLAANWVNTRGNVLLNVPMKQLEQQCDPEPFLKETEFQLHCPGPKHLKITRKINYTSALQHAGRFEEARRILSGILPEQEKGIGHYNTVLIYRNRSVLSIPVAPEEAEAAFSKMLQAYEKVKNQKTRRLLAPVVACCQAEIHLLHQEYEQALEAYRPEPKTPLGKVCEAWFRAKVFLAQRETDKAKEQLEYVVHNGNRLYIVTEAKRLLEKMNTEEQ